MDTYKGVCYCSRVKIWTKQQRLILGLSDKEIKILGVLESEEKLNTVTVAERSNAPRITTRRILQRLVDRGLVVRAKRGRSVWWTLVSPAKFESKVATIFKDSGVFLTSHIGLSEVGSLTIYRGVEEMIESNRNMLIAHPGERVLAIEPSGLWKYFAKIDPVPIHQLNLLLKEKQILIEIVAEEGFDQILTDSVDTGVGQSFLSLAVDIKVVPPGTLDSATEVLIFRDRLLLMDWAHLVAVEIKNPSTLRVIRAMFRTLQSSGWEYDIKTAPY